VPTKEEEPPLEALAREVRRLFHELRRTAEVLHADPEIGAAHRAVLESLFREGPQTVPMLARSRPVARQHIQVLVNRLLELRLVTARENPAHRRSPVIELTASGRTRFERMRRREHRALASLDPGVTDRDVLTAAATLAHVRESLAREFGAPATRDAGRGPRGGKRRH
jgi:DNA-binding MarR family transcriptional regulator